MLMVLMALVELGKTRVHKATRWLWLLLSGGLGAATLSSCEGGTDTPDAVATDTIGGDANLPDNTVVYYGPAVCTSDAACVAQHGQGWYCDAVTLVCQPGDAMTVDVPVTPDVPKDCEPMVAYGPPSCSSDADCQGWGGMAGGTWYCDTANPVVDPCRGTMYFCREGQAGDVIDVPSDVPDATIVDCGNIANKYGPPPCTSDADCAATYGADYACVKTSDDPCAPAYCQQRPQDVIDVAPDAPADCGPIMVAYGPPPCTSDADCAGWYGEGYYCPAPVGGNPCELRMCQPIPADAAVDATPDAQPDCSGVPVPAYGVQISCASDKDCAAMGDGWKCVQPDPCQAPTCRAP